VLAQRSGSFIWILNKIVENNRAIIRDDIIAIMRISSMMDISRILNRCDAIK
jgi:hypothetical protein